jgi:hypothetical protein
MDLTIVVGTPASYLERSVVRFSTRKRSPPSFSLVVLIPCKQISGYYVKLRHNRHLLNLYRLVHFTALQSMTLQGVLLNRIRDNSLSTILKFLSKALQTLQFYEQYLAVINTIAIQYSLRILHRLESFKNVKIL